MAIEEFLNDMVLFINQVRENPDLPDIKVVGRKLAQEYFTFKKEKLDILDHLDRELGQDTELYVLVLSVLFFLFKEDRFLDKAEDLLFQDGLSYDNTIGVWRQIEMNRFRLGREDSPYDKRRRLQEHLVKRLSGMLSYPFEMIPYEKRNHNRIIIATDTLLTDFHAPTKIVLDLAKALQEMNYEVLVLVCAEQVQKWNLENIWIYPYMTNYNLKHQGYFKREYQKTQISCYQERLEESTLFNAGKFFDLIYDRKPEFVWYVGGMSIIAELFSRITTLVAMNCIDGYPVSSAPILLSSTQNNKTVIGSMRKFMKRQGQCFLDISINMEFFDSGKEYQLTDFGIPEDGFAIAIVGNRLDTEITKEFIQMMGQILESEANVYFVLIGKDNHVWSQGIFRDRVICLGFCEDMYNVLKSMNLFMNPKRQGGGGAAMCAVSVGVPVLTLGDGDVALVGEQFICDRIEEYPDMVHKYCKDPLFYQKQSQYALECAGAIRRDSKESCSKVIQYVREWIQSQNSKER